MMSFFAYFLLISLSTFTSMNVGRENKPWKRLNSFSAHVIKYKSPKKFCNVVVCHMRLYNQSFASFSDTIIHALIIYRGRVVCNKSKQVKLCRIQEESIRKE